MLKRFLYRSAFLFSLLIAASIGKGLDERTGIRGAFLIPLGVVVLVFVIIIPLFNEHSFELGLKWDEFKRRRFLKKVRRSGLSEGEYIMTILPKKDAAFFTSHADDLKAQENYAKYLAHIGTITFAQSDALVRYIRSHHFD